MNLVNSWVEISRKALLQNIRTFQNLAGKHTELMPIIKSNAYGHGMPEVAKILEGKVPWMGVVDLQEALELRRRGITTRICILSFFIGSEEEIKEALDSEIHFPLYALEDAEKLNRVGEHYQKKIPVHVKMDTGTSRLGVLPDDAREFLQNIRQFPYLDIQGIFSHFAASEELPAYTKQQLERFQNLVNVVEVEKTIPYKHITCTAAILLEPKSHLNLVRLGIGLYGLWPSKQCQELVRRTFPDFSLEPVLTWKTRIIQIKTISKGTPVGYGCTHVVKRDTKIAVLPVGYWDGYDRRLSNQAQVLIQGKRCNILGRICMNLCMVDMTDLWGVDLNTDVVLLGRQGSEKITADALADNIGTINYEAITRINPLLPRIIVS